MVLLSEISTFSFKQETLLSTFTSNRTAQTLLVLITNYTNVYKIEITETPQKKPALKTPITQIYLYENSRHNLAGEAKTDAILNH